MVEAKHLLRVQQPLRVGVQAGCSLDKRRSVHLHQQATPFRLPWIPHVYARSVRAAASW